MITYENTALFVEKTKDLIVEMDLMGEDGWRPVTILKITEGWNIFFTRKAQGLEGF